MTNFNAENLPEKPEFSYLVAFWGLLLAGFGGFLALSVLSADLRLEPAIAAQRNITGLAGVWLAYGAVIVLGYPAAYLASALIFAWGGMVMRRSEFWATWTNALGGGFLIVAAAIFFGDLVKTPLFSGGLIYRVTAPYFVFYLGNYGALIICGLLVFIGGLLTFGNLLIVAAEKVGGQIGSTSAGIFYAACRAFRAGIQNAKVAQVAQVAQAAPVGLTEPIAKMPAADETAEIFATPRPQQTQNADDDQQDQTPIPFKNPAMFKQAFATASRFSPSPRIDRVVPNTYVERSFRRTAVASFDDDNEIIPFDFPVKSKVDNRVVEVEKNIDAKDDDAKIIPFDFPVEPKVDSRVIEVEKISDAKIDAVKVEENLECSPIEKSAALPEIELEPVSEFFDDRELANEEKIIDDDDEIFTAESDEVSADESANEIVEENIEISASANDAEVADENSEATNENEIADDNANPEIADTENDENFADEIAEENTENAHQISDEVADEIADENLEVTDEKEITDDDDVNAEIATAENNGISASESENESTVDDEFDENNPRLSTDEIANFADENFALTVSNATNAINADAANNGAFSQNSPLPLITTDELTAEIAASAISDEIVSTFGESPFARAVHLPARNTFVADEEDEDADAEAAIMVDAEVEEIGNNFALSVSSSANEIDESSEPSDSSDLSDSSEPEAQNESAELSDIDDAPDSSENDDPSEQLDMANVADVADEADMSEPVESSEPSENSAPAEVAKTASPIMAVPRKLVPITSVPIIVPAQPIRDEPEKAAPYILPEMSILDLPPPPLNADIAALERRATQLIRTLNHFKIQGQVISVQQGPRITQFEIAIAAGIPVSKIRNLADNIAMDLRAISVRIIAPIPGRDTIGIEIPNLKSELVALKEIVDQARRSPKPPTLPLCLAKDVAGNPIIADLAKMPHLLIAGSTGSGKSVCINSIIMSFLMCMTPEQCKLIMVDPKVVELSRFHDIPHLMSPVITDMQKAVGVLEWACQEMDERYEKLSMVSVNNLEKFNALSATEIEERVARRYGEEELEKFPRHLPCIVIIIDELADLMMVAKKEVEHHIARLAAKSRAVGIHLILATQRPSADVITGLIKANMPSRIAFQVASKLDSRIILDQSGADALLGQGDMLYLPPGTGKVQRAQGVFVSDAELFRVVDYCKQQREPEYHAALSGATISSGNRGEIDFSKLDELFYESGETIIEEQRGSVSLLQRKFGIGYGRAARIVDQLAECGVLGAFRGSGKPREILLDMESFQSAFSETDRAVHLAGLRPDEKEREPAYY